LAGNRKSITLDAPKVNEDPPEDLVEFYKVL